MLFIKLVIFKVAETVEELVIVATHVAVALRLAVIDEELATNANGAADAITVDDPAIVLAIAPAANKLAEVVDVELVVDVKLPFANKLADTVSVPLIIEAACALALIAATTDDVPLI